MTLPAASPQPHVGGGGFVPALKRTTLVVSGGPNFDAAPEHAVYKLGGVTMAQSVAPAPDSLLHRIIKAGTLITPITSGPDVGKYGVHDPAATDGRQTPDPDVSGYLPESIDLRDGDVICGCMISGSVLKARVTPAVNTTIRTAVAGRFIFQ